TKPVQTRDGRPARIICTDAKRIEFGIRHPIVAEIEDDSTWSAVIVAYTESGHYFNSKQPSSHDLINVSIQHKYTRTNWVNIYPDGVVTWHSSRHEADVSAAPKRIACKQVTIEFAYEEGEGL